MPLPHSRGFCKIKFFSAIALGCSITAICFASSAAQSVGEPIVAGESGGRSPFVNNNLQSQLKLNRETADDRDRLPDLYSGSELDRDSKEPETDIPEFAAAAPSQEPETIAGLPNRGDNRQEIPLPNPVLPNPAPLPEPPPPAPLPPIEQLLPRVPGPAQSEELPNIPGTITVDRFEVVGSTVFSKQELDAALKNFVGRPLTFPELLEARSAVSQLYISKGFITSGALIPPQTLAGGVVRILVLEGKLESINVVGTRRLNSNYVRRRLVLATRGPLNEQRLLEALQLLQLSGQVANISAELQAGSRPGFNLLLVRVKEAKTFQAGIFTDNSRSPSVGSWRRGVEVREANLSGLGDNASLIYTNTQGSNAVDLTYTLPVNSRNGTLSFNASRSKSNIVEQPFDGLDIEASSRTYELTYRQPIVQTARTEIAIGIGAGRRESDTSLLGEGFGLSPGADARGRTRVSALSLFQDFTQRGERDVLAARSQFNLGVSAFGATASSSEPDGQFLTWRGQLQYVRLLAPQTLLVVRSQVQLAGGELLPIEQFGLGGPDTVRGYRQDAMLADSGLFASAELRYPILRTGDKKGILQVTPFVDAGNVWNRGGRAALETNTLLSAGLGLRWQYGERWNARLGWGIPVIDIKSSDRSWQERGLYFSVEFKPF
ncbi:MAG: ShlB/FhaC/HecB family hemolysin secretion/activation protein [Microcoleus sp. PH2017_10_PVI_O_A]|nr:ShlB/FhaC/HecB family hemolysin secretion/activation protein [Microcoleus sp. PH2017_10_PVI_O_A]MCC3461756.1 ShlB/FhaC/HecB family hemolysin secretion/activation protein [Microcoleus sp. PH2017_11_PCY_U_A]MCC3480171.1 ShlB/FhaC/HecB family hemolysin secretion/activation protein [Microcoleus sp. PH2017_12_PCY_D_A]MCC3531743.1 ShlB/FhaC/HecB family hemolysin secretion/activation protein [Microcoleus sp. PH2017_21_RUC_O_A]MCC3544056.1 ShlB/FhaC/HecB family hemolysin secretion/activation protein